MTREHEEAVVVVVETPEGGVGTMVDVVVDAMQ
jgi:hypothetical protein